MDKVPFTAKGFKELEAALYALSDHELLAEASAVNADYVAWAVAHVALDDAQVRYLSTFDPNFIRQLGFKASVVLANRLPMELDLPDDYEHQSRARGNKWFFDHTWLEITDDTVQPPIASGALTYKIEFL